MARQIEPVADHQPHHDQRPSREPARSWYRMALLKEPPFGMKDWLKKALIGSVSVIIAITFIVDGMAAFSGIPIPDGDAAAFYSCIFTFATTYKFTNPFIGLCIKHGWLYPYLTALFPWSKSYQTIGISNLIICMISFVISAVALSLISQKYRLLEVLLCLPIALLVRYQQGRPELVVTGLVAGAAIVLTSPIQRNEYRRVWWGALLGITAAASPSAGVSYAVLTVAVSAIRSPDSKEFLLETLSLGIISVLTLLGATLLFAPVSLEAWLIGIFTQAITDYVIPNRTLNVIPNGTLNVIPNGTLSDFLKYYVFNPGFPALVIYLLLGVAVMYKNIKINSGWRQLLLMASFFVLTVYIFYMAIRMPQRNYNFMLLIPAIVFAGAHLIETAPVAAKWLRYGTIGISGVAAIALIYGNVTMLISLTGVTEPQFEAGMKFLSSRPGIVQTSMAFGVPLAEVIGYKRVKVRSAVNNGLDASYIVLKQANSGKLTPPQIPFFRIMVNRFAQNIPGLLGVKIANTRKDWGYAIYCRGDAIACR
jgi:hypothetical protein